MFPAPVEPWYTQLGGDPDGTSGFITAGRSFSAARHLGRHLHTLALMRFTRITVDSAVTGGLPVHPRSTGAGRDGGHYGRRWNVD